MLNRLDGNGAPAQLTLAPRIVADPRAAPEEDLENVLSRRREGFGRAQPNQPHTPSSWACAPHCYRVIALSQFEH